MFVKVKKLSSLGDLPLPKYAKDGDVARDLYAAIDGELTLAPGSIEKVPTGIALDLGLGLEGQVRPRSGLSAKGILVHFGTIDSSYVGEVRVIIHNLSGAPFIISRGDRIAQLIISSVTHYEWQEVDELRETSRSNSGFGSTGLK